MPALQHHLKTQKSARHGFTLVELLLIVSLIGILGGLVGVNYKTQIDKGFDAERRRDLSIIQRALEEYFNDHSCYPTRDQWEQSVCLSDQNVLSSYLPRLPCDPVSKIKYVYLPIDRDGNICEGSCGQCAGYRLLTSLSDISGAGDMNRACQTKYGCGYRDVNGKTLNYGIAMGGQIYAPADSGSGIIQLSPYDAGKSYSMGDVNPSITSTTHSHLPLDSPQVKKVLVLDFNPSFPEQGNKRLRELKGWNDPATQEKQFIRDIASASGNVAQFIIAKREDNIDEFPTKEDGFIYSSSRYWDVLSEKIPAYTPDVPLQFQKVVDTYHICDQVNSGAIDEVWLWGGPYFGFWDTVMIGPDAYYLNAPPITDSSCTATIIMMGFRYDETEDAMLAKFANRMDSMISFAYSDHATKNSQPRTNWSKFTQTDTFLTGKAGCGFPQFAPNAPSLNDWSNIKIVSSYCDDWLGFPELLGNSKNISCAAWGCTKRGFMMWWMMHLPNISGSTNGMLNNWWKYGLGID